MNFRRVGYSHRWIGRTANILARSFQRAIMFNRIQVAFSFAVSTVITLPATSVARVQSGEGGVLESGTITTCSLANSTIWLRSGGTADQIPSNNRNRAFVPRISDQTSLANPCSLAAGMLTQRSIAEAAAANRFCVVLYIPILTHP